MITTVKLRNVSISSHSHCVCVCVSEWQRAREHLKSTLSKFLIYNIVLLTKVIMLYITFLNLFTLHNCNFARTHLFWDTTESLLTSCSHALLTWPIINFPIEVLPLHKSCLSFLPQTKELFVHPTAHKECQIYFGKPKFSPCLLLPLFISSSFLIPYPFIYSVHSSSLSYHSPGLIG